MPEPQHCGRQAITRRERERSQIITDSKKKKAVISKLRMAKLALLENWGVYVDVKRYNRCVDPRAALRAVGPPTAVRGRQYVLGT